ncbi:MAG: hypothetical protein ACKOQ7_05130, partial [Actinomycetota bacterium]
GRRRDHGAFPCCDGRRLGHRGLDRARVRHGALGLDLVEGDDVDDETLARAAALDAARASKDFATADKIRAELQAAGWNVETTKEGTRVRRG